VNAPEPLQKGIVHHVAYRHWNVTSSICPCSWFCSRPIGQNTQRALQPYFVCIWMTWGKDGVKVEKAKYFRYSMTGSDAADGPAGVSVRRGRLMDACNTISGIGRARLASHEEPPCEADIDMPTHDPLRQPARGP
jgi:hypothetical protein